MDGLITSFSKNRLGVFRSKNASKDKMLTYLKNNCGITQTLTFGTVAGKYDVVIKKNSFNEMVKRVRKKYEPFIGIKTCN